MMAHKTLRYIIPVLLTVTPLAHACYFDHVDEDTSEKAAQLSTSIQLDVRVCGRMVSSDSDASESEMAVSLFDVFVFKVSSEGELLEYVSMNNMPDRNDIVAGSPDKLVASLKIDLPSSGTKRVLVVANANENKLRYPDLTTIDNSMYDDHSDVTSYAGFTAGLKFNFTKGKTPVSPFLMTGRTLVASSLDASVFVTLGRAVSRMDVSSGSPDIVISTVSFDNAPRECWPYVNDYSKEKPAMVNYPLMEGASSSAYFLYTPSAETKEDDFRLSITVQGTWKGAAFSKVFYCPSPLYADYRYSFTVKEEEGSLVASCHPDWSTGTFSVSGVRLRNNTFTFPFLADKNWGYELNWNTNLTGDVEVTRAGDEPWYAAAVDGDIIRVRCLEDNYGTEPRSATFTVSLGKYSHEISVIQQPAPSTTVHFNGWEWMDRNLGATLPLTVENITNSDCFGYYYQWGRNVPFPTFGTVATVPASSTRTSAQAEAMPEFILGDSNLAYEWLTLPPVPADRKTTWKDRTGGKDPCPEGYHVPSYMEYQTILPYTNAAGIGNFSNVVATIKSGEVFNGKEYDALYVTSGYEESTIYAIKRYKTDEAYYLRLSRALAGTTPYLRIDCVKGGAAADFAGAENPDALDAAAILASAKSFWGNVTDMETLLFPPCGRRVRNTGETASQGSFFVTWSATTWDGNSSSPYFDAIGTNNRIYNMANNRAHAHTVRCLKDHE